MTGKFKYILLLIFVILSSCEDWLDLRPPDGLVQDEYWKSKEDVRAVLMGAYQQLAQMDELLFQLGEVRADMIDRGNNTPAYIENIMDGNIYPDNRICDWSEFYKIINYCNLVLHFNPVVFELDPTYSEIMKQGIEAEALFLRSLSYFYLVRFFKDVPFATEATVSDSVNIYLPVTKDTEILSAIKEDLKTALEIAPNDYGSVVNNLGRATKNGINALLADISLWNFEYEESISYIEEIENSLVNLVPGSQWYTIYYPGNTLEGIFEIQYDEGLGQGNSLFRITYTENSYKASQKAVELLSRQGADEYYRGDGSFRSTDLKIWKYCGAAGDAQSVRPSSERSSGNWIIYRFADILLMKAEALSQLGEYDQAINYLNRVRKRASMAVKSAPGDAESFEDLILEERAKEFAFEGKRWFDLMRMGRRNDYARKDKLISIIVQNVPSNKRLVLVSKLSNPLGWYLPISDDELERNKELKQNPYYEGY
ncbi:MAG: RagB/SusD family nutrient uptake outer membrane protein [Bacteroidales bacterium]|nr:RagB/SusD family nutrient uptake outer membrane protein [Bacteroidales bacterium]